MKGFVCFGGRFFKRTGTTMLLLFALTGPAMAGVLNGLAERTVSGRVTDENNEPLPGVSIVAKGKKNGTSTDADGKFKITVQEEETTLVFSFVGFQTQEVLLNNQSVFNVSLKSDAKSLQEIVVVGYGTQKKVNLTGAVDQVTSEVLENRSLPNLTQGLQGVIPNLNLKMGDGKPIQSPSYNIRGTTSIGQGGNALVLIDGVEGDPSRLNPNDVASVSVLKDAASASIYGARGAFGVVLITTRNPVKDRTSVTYSVNQSIKSPTATPDFVTNGYLFAKMFNEGWSAWNDYSQTPQNVNKTVRFSPAYLAELERRDKDPSLPKTEVGSNGEYVYYENMDWYKELYKKNTSATEHNLSFSGSSGKADFYVTGRYYNQEGLFKYNSDDYKILSVRAKGSIQLYPWLKVTNNADFSSMKYHNPLNVGEGGSIWRNISDEGHTMAPMFNPDGTLTYSAAYTVGDFWYGKNGIDMDKRVFRNTTDFSSKFFSDKLRINGNFTFQNTDNNEYRTRVAVPYSRKPGVIEYVGTNTNDLQNIYRETLYTASNLYAEYEPKFSRRHDMKVLVGYNYEQSNYQRLEAVRNGIIYEDATDINLALGQSITTSGGKENWAILGGFYRLNYAFDEKYLVEINGRYDGSSKFPSDQRYAFFPSVSVGWRVANESFWKVSPKAITDLKIRASYGSLGNGTIGSYAFQEQFAISQSGRILNGIKPQQTTMPGVIPAGLTWETSTTGDVGLDVGLLNNRLSLTADAYWRKTTDMFTVGMTLPAVFGTNVPKGNYADLTTKGWEAVLTWRDKVNLGSKPLGYEIRLTMSDYTSKIDKYNNPDQRLSDYYAGQTVGEIWGYTTAGFFTSAEDVKNSPKQNLFKASNTGQWLPGDIKFADLNGDGVIDNGNNTVASPGDMKVIGNTTPRYTYGVMLGADWNNFFFSGFFQGVGKQDWWPGAEAGTFWGQYNRPYNKLPSWQIDNIWSESNPNAYLPRYRGYVAQNGQGELKQAQTKYLQNVAYIRLKNVQLGYNLPKVLIQKVGMNGARVFVSGENLWSYSPMYKITRDMDVESATASDQVVTSGTSGDGHNYPILKTFTVGLSATF
ncbi:SusC/RagA family TonB-linked outer membrane protein [Emticicia sp. CRIBPO]|uniref:SusC/RagA family TonB-linked outer membrane protein n=1 Tax=Emticicia sp. CRIBPO TaxID=2683258 RepID=UPI00141283CC|nr:TonB-dependent receptor [Emticicia sp. CRIBPO]NBA84630.1 SusC/RagA family TonB-linked outer membrane protein [Emticicia sp. CRIBPO]